MVSMMAVQWKLPCNGSSPCSGLFLSWSMNVDLDQLMSIAIDEVAYPAIRAPIIAKLRRMPAWIADHQEAKKSRRAFISVVCHLSNHGTGLRPLVVTRP